MTQVLITIDILEYLPTEFRYDDFSFIFSSESKDFEQEISFLNKNQIFHRVNLLKKDIKYSIKVTKNGSLLGLCDLIIPQSILSKRENIFDKVCNINMTDSIRRILFGSPQSNIVLKLNIHVTLQYKEKDKTTNKNVQKKNEFHLSKELNNSSKKLKIQNNLLEKDKTYTNYHTKNDNQKKNISSLKKQRSTSKSKSVSQLSKINNNINNNDVKKNSSQKELLPAKKENVNIESSFMDDELNTPVQNIDNNFLNFMNNFEQKNPLQKINEFNNTNDMIEYTKNNITQLLDYQTQYYNLLKNSLIAKNKYKNFLVQYNEKYRLAQKKLNKLNELTEKSEIESNIINNPDFTEINELNHLVPVKENELDIFKNIYNNYLEQNNNNDIENNNQEIQEKQINDDTTQSILVKVLEHIIKNNGPVDNILNQSNSEESERINLKNLVNKYKLLSDNGNINVENENVQKENNVEKFEYVLTNKPDKIDIKLENYLKYLYSQRTFPKIVFKKLSSNNYEYGSQKVMVKIEGDSIRVRFIGGYSLIDKFIEVNSVLEESKELKKKANKANNNSGLSNSKKKTGKTNKYK